MAASLPVTRVVATSAEYRRIDFKRRKDDIPAKVATVEYDPNRSARIALLHYADGAKAYILCPEGLSVGDTVLSGTKDIDIKPGNCTTLEQIPVGTLVHAVEFQPGKGAANGTCCWYFRPAHG